MIPLLCLGIVAGCLVGLVGVGATLVTLPVLFLWFPHFMLPSLAVKMAIATTLACATVSVIFAASLHWRQGNINYKLCTGIILIYLVTATAGPFLVHLLPAKSITIVLSVVLILIAIKLLLKKPVKKYELTRVNPVTFVLAILLAGFTNSICGIGSGNVAIPYLSRHYPQKQAVAAPITAAVFACLLGAISYVVYGWNLPSLPAFSFGYVYLLAFVPIAVGIAIGTPTGHRLVKKVRPEWLRYLLAVLVAFAGVFALLQVVV
jgi:uncharacterized membrane protein YfcA